MISQQISGILRRGEDNKAIRDRVRRELEAATNPSATQLRQIFEGGLSSLPRRNSSNELRVWVAYQKVAVYIQALPTLRTEWPKFQARKMHTETFGTWTPGMRRLLKWGKFPKPGKPPFREIAAHWALETLAGPYGREVCDGDEQIHCKLFPSRRYAKAQSGHSDKALKEIRAAEKLFLTRASEAWWRNDLEKIREVVEEIKAEDSE